jgi:PKD repeat protein
MKKTSFFLLLTGFFISLAEMSSGASVSADFSSSKILSSINKIITFTDQSTAQLTNITSWKWDFNGDGIVDQINNNNNPVNHQYGVSGVYPVILTVSDGALTSSKTRYVTIAGADADTCFNYLPVQGLESEKMGAAAWNTYPGAPEPAVWGHNVPSPPASLGWAYYYLGSRDYDGIDPQSSGAMHVIQGIDGWPNLSQALVANGYTPEDITVTFGAMSLGNDVQGIDWNVVGNRETRYYQGGTYKIKLRGENLISGIMPVFTMYIDYFMFLGGTDIISGKTGQSPPADNSLASSPAAKNVAAAFMADCGHFSLHFLFSSIQIASQFEFFRNKRYGGNFEIQQGFILKACPCSSITVNAGDTLHTLANTPHQLNPDIDGGVAPLTYEWVPSDGLSNSSIINPIVTTAVSQTYTLTVTDQRGCTGQSAKTVEVVTEDFFTGRISEINKSAFSIIKNDKEVIIKNLIQNSEVVLYEITGRILNIQNAKIDEVKFEIPDQGIYIIQIGNGKDRVLIKTVM